MVKVTRTMEVWKQVGEKEEVIGEYTHGSYISPEFAFLWNKDMNDSKAMKILKILVEVKKVKKTKKSKTRR